MKRNTKLSVLLLSLLAAFVGAVAYYSLTTTVGSPSLTRLAPLSLHGYRSVLILAPHSDDETLASAGLIQSALRAGLKVHVVIATNGDGFLLGTMENLHRIYPSHADFVRMGNLRQQESLAAMQGIGLRPEQVDFLSYPDRGTAHLWEENWSATDPFRSPFTSDSRSPYRLTYNPKSVYSGEDYLADVRSILSSYRPDLVICPHPDDVHPDHWGLSAFSLLAVALQERQDPTFHPDMYTYLVHRPDFPEPRGLRPSLSLLPPTALYELDSASWVRVDLDAEEVLRKEQAVDQYRSQLPLLRELLVSFIRTDEIFARPLPAVLADMKDGDPWKPETWRAAQGRSIEAIQKDPVRDLIVRTAVSAADLTATYAARTPHNSMAVCGQVRSETDSVLMYRLSLLAVGRQGILQRHFQSHGPSNGDRIHLAGSSFCIQVDLADLGDPWLVFVGARVEEIGVGILDQIAWQQVDIPPAPDLAQ